MPKTSKATPGKNVVKASPAGAKVVRNPRTGETVTVMGYGALEGDGFEIKKNVNLLKPIAKQALASRRARSKQIKPVGQRKAG